MPSDAIYVCAYTNKQFKSQAAYDNYLKSKKYKQLVAQAAKAESARAAAADAAGPSEPTGGVSDVAEPAAELAGPAATAAPAADDPPPPKPPPPPPPPPPPAPAREDGAVVDAADDSDGSSGWEDAESDDDDGPWVANECESLFDGHESASFEANAAYMRRYHSFFVPYLDELRDARGLFGYFHEKVCRRHTCLFCGRSFGDVRACREHMRAKAHRRFDFERDAGARAFYGLGADDADDGDDSDDDEAAAARWRRRREGEGEAPELVLPSGARLTHRSLGWAVRQRARPDGDDHRAAVRAALSVRAARRREAWEGGAGGRLVRAAPTTALGRRLELRRAERQTHALLVRSARVAGGTSKALAAGYTYKAGFADNKHTRALQHHGYGGFGGGAHFTMSGSRAFHKGNKIKGLVQRKAGGTKTKAAQAAAARGKSKTSR